MSFLGSSRCFFKFGDVACDEVSEFLGWDVRGFCDSWLVQGEVCGELVWVSFDEFFCCSLDKCCSDSSHNSQG